MQLCEEVSQTRDSTFLFLSTGINKCLYVYICLQDLSVCLKEERLPPLRLVEAIAVAKVGLCTVRSALLSMDMLLLPLSQ